MREGKREEERPRGFERRRRVRDIETKPEFERTCVASVRDWDGTEVTKGWMMIHVKRKSITADTEDNEGVTISMFGFEEWFALFKIL